MKEQNQIEIYQANDGTTQIKVQFEQDTVWLTQSQMAELFQKDIRTISEHIQNIYSTEELISSSTLRKFRRVRQEGKRQVTRNIDHYNLDVIISVGYRVNSKQGTQFRIWANSVLKDYIVKGYSINEKRLAQKEQEVRVLKNGIQILSVHHTPKKNPMRKEHLLEFVELYNSSNIYKREETWSPENEMVAGGNAIMKKSLQETKPVWTSFG